MADDRYCVESCSNQPQRMPPSSGSMLEQNQFRTAGQPNAILLRQAAMARSFGVCAGIADYKRAFDVALVRICFSRCHVHQRRFHSALLFYRRAGSRRPILASSKKIARGIASSGRVCAHLRRGRREIFGRGSRTSIAGWRTSKATSPPKTGHWLAKSSSSDNRQD